MAKVAKVAEKAVETALVTGVIVHDFIGQKFTASERDTARSHRLIMDQLAAKRKLGTGTADGMTWRRGARWRVNVTLGPTSGDVQSAMCAARELVANDPDTFIMSDVYAVDMVGNGRDRTRYWIGYKAYYDQHIAPTLGASAKKIIAISDDDIAQEIKVLRERREARDKAAAAARSTKVMAGAAK